MEAIKNQLLDPVFWFAVIFVGVIVNLFSSYLKDLLAILRSKIVRHAREQKQIEERRNEKEARFLEAHPELLTFKWLDAIAWLVLGFGCATIGFTSMIILKLQPTIPTRLVVTLAALASGFVSVEV